MNLSLIVVDLPNVNTVTINNGAAQRSKVESMTIEFDQQVNGVTAPGAIVVQRRDDNPTNKDAIIGTVTGVNISVSTIGSGPTLRTLVTLTFVPSTPFVDSAGSLVDGNYQVTVNAGLVTSLAGGFQLDGDNNGVAGDNFVFGKRKEDKLYRLFGDIDGANAAGQAFVDSFDAGAFLGAYNNPAAYDAAFDINEDGFVDSFDAGALLGNYGKQRDLNGFN
jgi:hypothetical protein